MDQPLSQSVPDATAEWAARQYVERWRQELLTGLWAVITGNKGVYREFKQEWKALCNDPTDEEISLAVQMIPAHMRWWEAPPRDATEREALLDCQQCGQPFGARKVKVCPNCKVVLHAACFDDSLGGYETPNCECCRQRCCDREC